MTEDREMWGWGWGWRGSLVWEEPGGWGEGAIASVCLHSWVDMGTLRAGSNRSQAGGAAYAAA